MKKISFIAALAAATLMLVSSCGAPRQMANTTPQFTGSSVQNPFGPTFEVPCAQYDTDEYFAATGIATGPNTRMDVLQTAALTNAQNIVRQKMQHAYKGAIDDYSNYIGTNAGTDADIKVERAGTQIIDQIINDTQARCQQFSGVDDKGNVTCYIGIQISKKETADKISDFVSQDEELRVRFQEFDFRQRMEENFKNFKEEE